MMRHEILMNFTPLETRIAAIEEGTVQEILIERITRRGLVGNVYLGKVVRVLPGMQSCFVDIGLEHSAILYSKDLPSDDHKKNPPIQKMVTEGQNLLVQVAKGPFNNKGARLTAEVSLPASHLIFMPLSAHVGVSQRIEDKSARERLKQKAQDALIRVKMKGGLIVRTAGEEHTADSFDDDLIYLKRVWDSILVDKKNARSPKLLFEELHIAHQFVRDRIRCDTERVLVDSEEAFTKLSEFVSKFMPKVTPIIHHYQGNQPIFDLYQVEDEIKQALARKVELKSGAYLIIDQTEAMTTIDVNTGRFVGSQDLEQTVFQTNLEAAVAIGRQLKLRNLSGIIVIDFINMEDEEHRGQVLQTLDRAISEDLVKTRLYGFSDLGLVELTRKRTREGLADLLQESCPNCHGIGKIKTSETVCNEIFRAVMRGCHAYSAAATTVIASPLVIDRLIEEESDTLADLEAFTHRPIRLQVDTTFMQDRYEVVVA